MTDDEREALAMHVENAGKNAMMLGRSAMLEVASQLRADGERIKALEAGRQWQPIETAPKDGQWILLYGMHARQAGNRQIVCCWDGDFWESSDDGYAAYINPSHWVPLPAPPKESGND